MVGTSISHYKVLEKIGEGGMGEVYRATDTKLNRDVALKILPEQFASDSQRMGRFQREAEVLASLDHPNIGQIYGIEEAGATKALVLQLIEGPTLAERIAQGPIPVEDALKIALQIAEGLEAAHEKGVIHRDLKPANIKINPEGQVKILDFGLAKALEGETPPDSSLSQSPTLTAAATQAGVILGTAGYMSPEQARGEPVDQRADVWAFGCVLFEILTGRGTFDGRTVSDVMAAVLAKDPQWTTLPHNLHPRLRLLLERCLEKESKDRYAGIGDARVDIQKVLADPMGVFERAGEAVPSTWRRMLPWVSGAVGGAVLAGILIGVLNQSRSNTSDRVFRTTITLPSDQRFVGRQPFTFSPDGTQLVYASTKGDQSLLYLRWLNEFEAVPIPGTEGAKDPFFKPDGEWVGFFAGGGMKKVSLTGGLPQTLAAVPNALGATWGEDGYIVYSPTLNSGLRRVSENGGDEPQVLTQPDFAGSGYGHVYPQYLPNGRDILFTIWGSPAGPAAVYSLDTMEWEILLPDGSSNTHLYLPTGHLLLNQGSVGAGGGTNQLIARVFDLEGLEPRGGSVGVVESVFEVSGAGRPVFATSLDGTLGFEPPAPEAQIAWVDREGNRQPLGLPAGYYSRPSLSPNGDRITFVEGRQVLMREVATGTPTTIPGGGGGSHVNPVFTPDGRSITFASNQPGSWDIYEFQVDSNQAGQLLLGKDFDQFPESWSRDGRFLAYREAHPETSYDIWIWPRDDGEEWSFVQSRGNDRFATFSPNGEWIAYASDEFGRDQVYLCSFPDCSTRKTVSTGGGTEPRWSQDGRELFFRNGNRMWVVEILDQTTMELGDQDTLFEGVLQPRAIYLSSYDVHPDGRFLMLTDTSGHRINVVQNWFEELKRLVPTE